MQLQEWWCVHVVSMSKCNRRYTFLMNKIIELYFYGLKEGVIKQARQNYEYAPLNRFVIDIKELLISLVLKYRRLSDDCIKAGNSPSTVVHM